MKIVIISLVSLLCALSTQCLRIRNQDASKSGKNFKIDNLSILSGDLLDMKQATQKSQMDLNPIIANINGKLTFIGTGNYKASCNSCSVVNFSLKCKCQNSKGAWVDSTLPLGTNIENDNGNFTWVPTGTKVKVFVKNQ